MTLIDFYFHSDNKYRTACALSAKAVAQGLRVLIYPADTATADKLDELLWRAPPTGFLPHCRAGHALAAVTPIIIDPAPDSFAHDEVLLNLHPEWPPFFSRFQRLVEIVGTEENDRQAARQRFRFYRDRGYEIRSHDLSGLRQ